MPPFWLGFAIVLIGSVLAGIAAIVTRYLREMRAARRRIDGLGSRVIETACGPIEYARFGEGCPLLVIHGAMGGFDQGLWLARGFNLCQHQVISVSRFGYLRSPVPANANLDLQADTFAALLDALEIRQAAVFAASSGTTSAIRFAARHPQRVSALILLSPDAPGESYMDLPPRIVFETLLRSDFVYWVLVTYFAKSVQKAMGLAPRDTVLTPEYEALINQVQAGDLPVSQRMDGMIFETYTDAPEFFASVTASSPYPLDRIETPVMVINAPDDQISLSENVDRLADQLPNARRFVAPHGGHLLLGHTAEVQSEIAQFLRNNVAELQSER